MTKTSRNTAAAAEESFNRHYAAIWGTERWRKSLYPALTQPTRYTALVNRYAPLVDFWRSIDEAGIARDDLERLPLPETSHGNGEIDDGLVCFVRKASAVEDGTTHAQSFPAPHSAPSHSHKLMTHWNMDGASVLVAQLLDVQCGQSVLDLCAAPGGKSIALAQKLWPDLRAEGSSVPSTSSGNATGKLCANEVDPKRQKRLAENLHAYLPPQLAKDGRLITTRLDAELPGHALNTLLAGGGYDRVLVDAPCSSERHIIHANIKAKSSGSVAPEMANWRPGSSKRLAQTQLALLMAALKAVTMGGRVMYATCSIETVENDGVIGKMLVAVEKEVKRGSRWTVKLDFGDHEGSVDLSTQLEQWAERTQHGWIVLPDHPGGGRWGPLFFASITKIAVT